MALREGSVDVQLISDLYESPLFCPVVRLGVIADLTLLYGIEQFLLVFEKPFDIKLIFHFSHGTAITSEDQPAAFLFFP